MINFRKGLNFANFAIKDFHKKCIQVSLKIQQIIILKKNLVNIKREYLITILHQENLASQKSLILGYLYIEIWQELLTLDVHRKHNT
jgi:hypothetical protein